MFTVLCTIISSAASVIPEFTQYIPRDDNVDGGYINVSSSLSAVNERVVEDVSIEHSGLACKTNLAHYALRARSWYREFREVALMCAVYNIKRAAKQQIPLLSGD
jgi:hypothetical protein